MNLPDLFGVRVNEQNRAVVDLYRHDVGGCLDVDDVDLNRIAGGGPAPEATEELNAFVLETLEHLLWNVWCRPFGDAHANASAEIGQATHKAARVGDTSNGGRLETRQIEVKFIGS